MLILLSKYGIDYDAPIPSQDNEDGIKVPERAYSISDTDMTALKLYPLQQSNEYGMDVYEHIIQFLNNL